VNGTGEYQRCWDLFFWAYSLVTRFYEYLPQQPHKPFRELANDF